MTLEMSQALKQAQYACEKIGIDTSKLYCIENAYNKVVFTLGKMLLLVDFDCQRVMIHNERKKIYGGEFC